MKLVILDGTGSTSLASRFGEQAGITHFALDDIRLAPCLGDFECWTRTPGLCRTQDEIQDISRAIHDADLLVFLTPLVFGAYASALKKAVDRLIGLVDPFFYLRDGLTRHKPRYKSYPPILFIGLADRPSDEGRSIFAQLAAGNATNLLAPGFHSLVIPTDDAGWEERVADAIRAGVSCSPGDLRPVRPAEALAEACAPDPVPPEQTVPPRTASILIGSARPRGQSSSESLANGLIGGLEQRGIRTTLIHAISFVKDGRLAENALETILDSELLVVSSPLYVDGLPALTTRALEQLRERMRMHQHRLRSLFGILNCGFPEASHNRTAMRILRAFAHEAGVHWSGGLAMGAGEILHGKPLSSARLLMRHQIRALEMAAGDLAKGQALSPEAIRAMAQPMVPAPFFRWLAPIRWAFQARAHGVKWRDLHARPLDRPLSAP